MAPESMAPVVELLQRSEEYRYPRGIDPAAATSAADRIFEFISAFEDILGAGTFDGPSHGADWAVVQSGVPSNFVHVEREEDDAWRARVIPRILPTPRGRRATPGEIIWPSGPRSRRTSPGL